MEILIERKVEHKGLRYNEGKLRYDLFEPTAMEELAKIFTRGAQKYAPRNWEKGMSWTGVIASLKRHLVALEKGEDYDKETGLLHSAHVAWNALAITSYYKLYPQGDDRPHEYLNRPRIGLDIDGVLADFVGHLMDTSGNHGYIPKHWNDPVVRVEFEKVKKDPGFWSTIPTLIDKEQVPFEVHCYITARSIDPEVTKAWLDQNEFPSAPVYSIGVGESKVEVARKAGMDIFVDDNYANFVDLNRAGICTFLYDAPYNEKYDVGYKRIKSLKELV